MHPVTRIISSTCLAMALALPAVSEADSAEPDTTSKTQTPAPNEPGSQKSVEQIAREMTNPLAAFWRFDYIGEHRNYQGSIPGADDQKGWIHNFQFTLPFREKDGKGWVFRFSLPYLSDQPVYWADRGYAEWLIRQEDPTGQEGAFWAPTHAHTDAVTFDLVYGGVNESGRILNYGVAGVLPTTSDTSNGRQQFILGPAVNIGKMTDWGVYGVLFSHIIDIVEKRNKGAPDTTQTTLQAYFSYDLGRGWQLISNPTVTYDWEADSGNKLNLPLGGGIANTFKIGKIPFRLTAEVQYFVASTDRFGPDWLYKFSLSPIMPSKHTRH
ncbi:MAG: hypothetical protein QNK19_04150 [Xanthomonadales bacterium]|nr:hypothetical protein [Xanthomonadales bacterium]